MRWVRALGSRSKFLSVTIDHDSLRITGELRAQADRIFLYYKISLLALTTPGKSIRKHAEIHEMYQTSGKGQDSSFMKILAAISGFNRLAHETPPRFSCWNLS